jgi:hypothetical protein
MSNVTSGNWNSSGSWTACGGLVPQSGDSVTIQSGQTITITSGNPANIGAGTVTINGTLTMNDALTSGNLSLNATGIITTNNNNLTVGNITISGTLNAGNSLIAVSGNWDSSLGTFNFTSSNIVKMTGSGKTITTPSAGNWYDTHFAGLTIDTGASVSVATGAPANGFHTGNMTINGTFTISSGKEIQEAGSTFTLASTGTLAGSGTLDRYETNTSTNTLSGTISITNFNYDI